MRILYVITQADGGGAQKYVLSLAKRFNGAIAAGTESGKLFDDAHKAGLDTFRLEHLKRNLNPWHDLLAMWEIRQLIDLYRPDIIHLNSTKAGILGSFASIGKNIKVIFTAHGFVFNEPLPFPVRMFYLAAEKVASDFRDMIIAVSDRDRQSALANKLISPEKITTIHNGIPAIDFLPCADAPKALGLPIPHSDHSDTFVPPAGGFGSEYKFIFATIANFYKTKGLDVLVEAVAMLDKEVRDRCTFVMIGEGTERKKLEDRIQKLGLADIFKLLGNIPDASRYLKAFDAFILPSRKEGFPYTLLEALQAGLPIITTDVGGNSEAIGDAGILIKTEDSRALADAICQMVNGRDDLAGYSQKAKTRSAEFTEERMLKETEKVYEKVAGSK